MVNRIVQGGQSKRVVRQLGTGMPSRRSILAYIVRCPPLRSSPGLTKHSYSTLRALEIRRRKKKYQIPVTHEARTCIQARTSGFILGTTA